MNFKKYLFVFILISFIVFPILSFGATPITLTPMPAISPASSLSPATTTTTGSSVGIICTLPSRPTLGVLFNYATCIISSTIIPLLFGIAIAMFIWGVVQYVINTEEESKKQKGKMFMIWGIVALTVMVSVWGLVGIVRNTFGIENVVPQLQTQG